MKVRLAALTKRVNDLTDVAANLWLEFRYGWTPLIYDIEDITKAIQNLGSKPERFTFRSKRPYQRSGSDEISVRDSSRRFDYYRHYTVRGKVGAGVLTELRAYGFADVFGFTKLPNALWDLTTLSFVVDWVFNVADTIAAWTPDTLYRPLTNWGIIDYESTQFVKLLELEFDNPFMKENTVDGWTGIKSTQYKQRIPGVPRDVLPNFVFDMNWKRYTDAVALIKGAFKSSLRASHRKLRI
jgi:hypothetical protein